jgi:hypothetical protein
MEHPAGFRRGGWKGNENDSSCTQNLG